MARYSYAELEQLWISAGGPKALAPLMAAIALAESGGDPAANNYTDNGGTQTSWGLWQVSNGTHQWPGTGNPNDPLTNARYAVAKYHSQGLTAWGTYDSGAYKRYYQGSVPPGSLPSGGGSPGNAPVPATLTAFPNENPNVLLAPFDYLNKTIQDVWGLATGTFKAGSGLDQIAKGFTGLLGLFDRLLHAVEWVFNPTHWVRIIAFGGGLLFLIPGLYSLMKTGQGNYGDITLALGILLTMISGILFFIAFHNLPNDVRDLQTLLAWLTSGIRTGQAEYAPSAVYGGGDLGPAAAPATSGGDFSGGPGASSFS